MISAPKRFFFKGQIAHLLQLLVLLVGAVLLVDFQQLAERDLLGVRAHVWFAVSLVVPVVHQVYVWLEWRSELRFRAVGIRLVRRAFVIYEIVFSIFLLARPASLILLTLTDHDSYEMSVPLRVVICVVLGIPAAYTLYSAARYFGIARATGIDHFEESCQGKLVKEGIFKYASNSMYSFAFLTLWVIAIAGASWAALVAAAFNRAYIWVHYCCTERPDMKLIYGAR